MNEPMPRTTHTRSIWLASFFIASGLSFLRAARLHDGGPGFRANFVFDDPDRRAPALTRQFLDDLAMQRLISARGALAAALDVTRQRGVCEAADVADELARVATPWAER
jgi:hypothetical protein